MLMAQSWAQLLLPSAAFAVLYLTGGLIWIGHWVKSSRDTYRIAQQFPRPEQNPDRSGIAIIDDWPDQHQQSAMNAPNNSFAGFASSARTAVLGEQQRNVANVNATRDFLERVSAQQPWELLVPHVWTLASVYLTFKIVFMCCYAGIIVNFHLTSAPTFRVWTDPLLVTISITAGFVSGTGMSLVCGICLGWCSIRQSITEKERHLMQSALCLGILTATLSHLMSSYAPLFSLAAPIILQRFLGPTLQQTFSSLTALINPSTGLLQLPRIMHPRSLAIIHTKLRWVDSIRRGVSVWILSLGIRELLALTIQTSSVRSGAGRDGAALDASAWTIFLINEIPDLALCVLLLWNLRLKEPVPWFGVGNGLLTVRAADLGRRNQPSQIPLTELPPMDSLDALHQQSHSSANKWALGIAVRHAKHSPTAYAIAYLPAHYHHPQSGLRLTLQRGGGLADRGGGGGGVDVAEMLAVREDPADREREGMRLANMFRDAMAAGSKLTGTS
ncbi:hypothetical protein BCR44DRAFT_69575 [Catenaria anguillulae PL171]|uniref:Uncharacterized protein n=1 Tax=Catenaria anguillulae PL171 TaxID=765915 RepID=A0A1Y2HQW0_9FUNG|nr:hypothetical protein BCR44DRAFT_69575 [Catenaria anguillulae PL171]